MAANSSIISVNCSLVLLAYSAIFSASGGQVRANEPYDDDQTSAGWAWARIKQGKEADFNIRCEDSPIQLRADAIPWADRCRIISGNVLVDLLTKSSLHDQVPFSGIKIANARITGEIDLQNAKFDRALTVVNSVIEGDINLTAARSASVVAFVESKIEGNFNAWQFRSDLSLDLSSTEFKQDIMLNDAVINGYLSTQTAIIGGKLNAGTLQVGGNLFMRSAKLRGSVVLNGAKIGGNIYADGASFDENIDADSLVIGASLSVRSLAEQKANFKSANLSNARIGGSIQMDGATFSDSLTADALQVGVSLFMQSTPDHQAVFKAISLKSARITGNLDLDGAWLQGDVVADSLQVGGSLVMRSARHNSSLIFIGAKIGNNLEMSNSAFGKLILTGASVMRNFIAEGVFLTGDFDANALQVGASLFMGATSKSKGGFRRININGARISGDLVFNGAMLQGAVNANSLQVGGSLSLQDAIAISWMSMNFVQVGGSFDIRGAVLADLDLSGSTISGDFRLSGPMAPYTNTFWRIRESDYGSLRLRNTRVTNLMDSRNAWPVRGKLELEGFRFSHLGGFEGGFDQGSPTGRTDEKVGTDSEMRSRGMEWWDRFWVQLDPIYSPTPYEQLAAALVTAGHRDAADEIRYLGRVQQRRTENVPSWIFSGFLQYAAGFGIGDRTFRVLYCVIGISIAGALYLWKSVPAARRHGPLWCFGASLGRLLPVIELNKEFTDFFNDPKRRRLTNLQVFIFSAIGVVGWVLGAILVAAVSGLTQKP